MKKPYLISLSSFTPGVERYLKTMGELQDSVEPVFVDLYPHIPTQFLCYFQDFNRYWYHCVPEAYPGNHSRMKYIPANLEEDRWWIFTDTHDVIFQSRIPDLDEYDVDVLLANEGENWEESGLWVNYLKKVKELGSAMDELNRTPIYNGGCFAMKGHIFKQYVNYLTNHEAFKTGQFSDQPLLNLFALKQKSSDCPALFMTIYKHMYNKNGSCEDGVFIRDGFIPSIVHGNGCGKDFLPHVF